MVLTIEKRGAQRALLVSIQCSNSDRFQRVAFAVRRKDVGKSGCLAYCQSVAMWTPVMNAMSAADWYSAGGARCDARLLP